MSQKEGEEMEWPAILSRDEYRYAATAKYE
jgi:hypothetical protein